VSHDLCQLHHDVRHLYILTRSILRHNLKYNILLVLRDSFLGDGSDKLAQFLAVTVRELGWREEASVQEADPGAQHGD
jgi:hypothetical protein